MSQLSASGITFTYPGAASPTLRDVSISIEPGRLTGLFGPNGSGKSTLLACLAGLALPEIGSIHLDGEPTSRLRRIELARQIALVPQHVPENVSMRVGDVVAAGRYPWLGVWGSESDADRSVCAECLDAVGAAEFSERWFDSLSGGEKRRVLVAKGLAQGADILLLDEPTAHLDIAGQLDVYELARGLAANGKSVLMVCHDLLLGAAAVHTAILMAEGTVTAVGPPREALSKRHIELAYKRIVNIGDHYSAPVEPLWLPLAVTGRQVDCPQGKSELRKDRD